MAANNLVNTKQDLIAALVQKELKESATLVPFVTDLSSLAVKGSKSIKVPKYTSFTVQNRAFGAAASENTPLSDSVDTINIDKNKIVLFGYDAHDEIQSTTNYMVEALKRAASAHGREVNADIIATWDSVASLSINSAPADITVNDILDMREHLIKGFADMGMVVLVIGADQEKALLKLPEFSRWDYRGMAPSPIVNGMIGTVYGIPVVINQQVASQQAYMVGKEGSAIAFQMAPRIAEEVSLKYGTGGRLVAVDQLYGVGGLQLGEGGAPAGKSPHVARLRS